jgi:hypothetical protein
MNQCLLVDSQKAFLRAVQINDQHDNNGENKD